ncbi:protein kinase domain-containing protein [Archangium lansingense]|uniref:protein kinase domain-containing protein n=1 Tax=Archangium lansingense TaxID=2995310 RepID=UPI003B7CE789
MQGGHIPGGALEHLLQDDALPPEEDLSDFEDSLLGAVSRADWPLRVPGPGERLGGPDGRRFEILEELGSGAMGKVFRAWDEELQRPVALKFLLLQETPGKESHSARLKQEARAVARLHHDNIVRVFDVAEWRGNAPCEPTVPFIVMEILEGESLASLLRRERPPLQRALELMIAVASGLAHAHAHHVIHRDLKPSNILLTREGGVKLLDFGLAYLSAHRSPLVPDLPTAGTPAYMAPEQWRGEAQDARTDLWSAGVILYELLTGELPYLPLALGELRERVLSPEPVPPVRARAPELPEEVEHLVHALLTKEPERRLRGAVELRGRLRRLAEELGPWREPSRPVLPQRRQVTLVSCRLVGLAEQLDPEDASELQAGFHQFCAELLREHDGTLTLSMGNEVLATFGHPMAREDDSERAVRAALHLTRAFPERLAHMERLGLAMTVGLHTDLVVFADNALQGEAPRLASWLARQGGPGTVVLGDTTWKLVRGTFETESLGHRTFEALSGGQGLELHRVLRERHTVYRFERALRAGGLSPLVGREHELERLRALWERARHGQGSALLLSGEAGVGKSRLLQELRERVPPRSSLHLLCQCWAQLQHSAFHPLLEMLRRFFQLGAEGLSSRESRGLEERLLGLGLTPEHVRQLEELLAPPITEGPESVLLVLEQHRERKRGRLEALRALLLRMAEERPVLLVVEDLHWADSSTLELLGLLLERVGGARILVLLSTRPEHPPAWPVYPWFHRLVLERLPAAPAEVLVREVARGQELPEETVRRLVAKTDGIPLFMEEMTRMVLEQGPSGRPSAIPATLNELLLARLDALPPRMKALAQLCAVVGRDFHLDLLSRISARDEVSLRQDVAGIVSAGLLLPIEEDRGGGYQFRHALLQEVAYQSLPRSLRRQHHRRIAQALLEHFPERVESRPEVLAHHRTEAGDFALAVQAWRRAAELAILRIALQEALSHMRQALRLIRELPDTPEHRIEELELLNGFNAMILSFQGVDAPELEQSYSRALELYRRMGQTSPQLVVLSARLTNILSARGRFQDLQELRGSLLALSQQVGDEALLAQVHRMEGMFALMSGGRLDRAEEALERTQRLMDSQGEPRERLLSLTWFDPRLDARLLLALTRTLLGHTREARWNGREALELMRARSYRAAFKGYVLMHLATVSALSHEVPRTLELAQESSSFSTSDSQRPVLGMAKGFLGWALVRSGQPQEGLETLREGLELMREMGIKLLLANYLALLADAHLMLGQVREGLTVVEEALGRVKMLGRSYYVAEIHRIRGELLRAAGQEDQALRCFLRARALAHRQRALLLELRATVSLGRQLRDLGCPERVRRRLERVASRMEPDPDSVDLQQAWELLDSLPPGGSGA